MNLGKHCFASLYSCDRRLLDDQQFLIELLEKAAREAGATVVETISKKFEPQGVTVLTLLSESHISIHTWPESGSAAVDVFTCGDKCEPMRAITILTSELKSTQFKTDTVER